MKKILFILSLVVLVVLMAPAIKFFWRVVAVGIQNPMEVIAVCVIGMILLIYYDNKGKISTAIEKML